MIRKLEIVFGPVLICAMVAISTLRAEDAVMQRKRQGQTTRQQLTKRNGTKKSVSRTAARAHNKKIAAPVQEQEKSSQFAETARESRKMYTPGQSRAPRPSVGNASNFSNADSALLAEIAACCCNLTNIITACCSQGGGGGGSCANIGSLDTFGICDSTLWSTIAGIQNAEQTVIGWLKTIMLELRGLC